MRAAPPPGGGRRPCWAAACAAAAAALLDVGAFDGKSGMREVIAAAFGSVVPFGRRPETKLWPRAPRTDVFRLKRPIRFDGSFSFGFADSGRFDGERDAALPDILEYFFLRASYLVTSCSASLRFFSRL